MADVIGPCSTLPGNSHPVPAGTVCDVHGDRPAVARIQGETDSFGAELNDMCQQCLDEYRAWAKEPQSGVCDWCKNEAHDLAPHRDFEEGFAGPVYDVCAACRRKEMLRVNEEFQERDDYDPFWDDDDDRAERDRTCTNCGGTGGEPFDDHCTPCEECDGEGYKWWL